MDIRDLIDRCHDNAVAKGWWPETRDATTQDIAEKLLMIHSEVSEATEELRIGKLIMYANEDKPDKPEGLEVELADVVIRVFDLVGRLDLDLESALLAKMRYNETRSHRHGGKAL